jgi:hypothetical protein
VNFIEKASRLYEQERRAASAAASPFEMYVRRWGRCQRGSPEPLIKKLGVGPRAGGVSAGQAACYGGR